MIIEKGLVTHVDKDFAFEQKTMSRYKEVRVKILDAGKSMSGKKATLYVNNNTDPRLILSAQPNVYIFNFNVIEVDDDLIIDQCLPNDFGCSLDFRYEGGDMFEIALGFCEKELGEEFATAMGKALRVRMDRRNQYGDSYLNDSYPSLINQIEDKLKRIKVNIENGGTSYEKGIDSACDAVNYAIFIGAKLIEETKKDQ